MLVFSIKIYCCNTENNSNDLCDIVFTVPMEPCTVANVNDFSIDFVKESLSLMPVDSTSTKVSNNSSFYLSHLLYIYILIYISALPGRKQLINYPT